MKRAAGAHSLEAALFGRGGGNPGLRRVLEPEQWQVKRG